MELAYLKDAVSNEASLRDVDIDVAAAKAFARERHSVPLVLPLMSSRPIRARMKMTALHFNWMTDAEWAVKVAALTRKINAERAAAAGIAGVKPLEMKGAA